MVAFLYICIHLKYRKFSKISIMLLLYCYTLILYSFLIMLFLYVCILKFSYMIACTYLCIYLKYWKFGKKNFHRAALLILLYSPCLILFSYNVILVLSPFKMLQYNCPYLAYTCNVQNLESIPLKLPSSYKRIIVVQEAAMSRRLLMIRNRNKAQGSKHQ